LTYGLAMGLYELLETPTPGAANSAGIGPFLGVVARPDVSVKGGCYVDAVDVILTCETAGAVIRYTTDGTVPSLVNGTDYSSPIHIESLTTLLATGFRTDYEPSDTRIETYVFIDPSVASFNSNLPIIVLDTLGEDLPNLNDDPDLDPYIDCRIVIIDTDAQSGRAEITGPEHFEGWGEIRRRGESTYGQGHYALEIQDEHRQDNETPLLGMPAESDWIVSFDVIDYSLLKNEIAFKWFRDMGHYAPRQRYAEVYLNTDGGDIAPNDYKGLFVLREKIKRDNNRVDVAKLDPTDNQKPEISGGYIIKSDKLDPGDTLLDGLETAPYGIHTAGAGKPILAEPSPSDVTDQQIDWIESHINEFHAVLWQNTGSAYYPGAGPKYSDYVDVESWIDHGFVEQIGLDNDAFWGSYFAHKDRNGKIHSGPPWDFDRSFHNNAGDYDKPYDVWKLNGEIFGKWHQRLQAHLEYKMALADRWFGHRESTLNTERTLAYIDERADLMSEATSRPQTKFYPNPFPTEVDLFKTWIANRLDWLDGEIANRFAERPPIFNPPAGPVDPGESLEISKPSGVLGTIYYTLDGSDPRLEGGAINPIAMTYDASDGPITESIVQMSSSIWKYLYDGSNQGTVWREYGFDDTSWVAGPGQLGFGEGDESTNIGPRVTGNRTAYFRHKFTVSNVSEIMDLKIELVHDDGAVVYLNGQEV
ncbi:MAG: CotH kinase family protein, partial [Candidatus Omnitrophica bacterium]|nr:CotH kinase family protein [Candidatus Omnitrophota bacterium]